MDWKILDLRQPLSLEFDSQDRLFIGTLNDTAIWMVESGIVKLIAGTGVTGLDADGPALSTQLILVGSLFADEANNRLLFTDARRVRAVDVSFGPQLPPNVTDALEEAGIDPEDVPPEILDDMVTADNNSLLITIPANGTQDTKLTMDPDEFVVFGAGSTAIAKVEGDGTQTVMIGDDVVIEAGIDNIDTLYIDGTNVVIESKPGTNKIIIGPGASAVFQSTVTVDKFEVLDGGSATINAKLDFFVNLKMEANSDMIVDGKLTCSGTATASIDTSAMLTANGQVDCAAI